MKRQEGEMKREKSNIKNDCKYIKNEIVGLELPWRQKSDDDLAF